MLIGEYTHTIDDKNRISLPSKFRKEVGKKLIATYGLEGCLFLYPTTEWEKISDEMGKMDSLRADTRGFNRFMFGGAVELEVDSLGRVLIPEYLREFAKIKDKGVFIGVHKRIEMWNDKKWAEYKQKVVVEADVLAEKLSQTGAF
ncbi:MAG: division/cell wall cluster transcriptional repressor MraZ, partial [Patescibacteria group bacterium]|nr:cell division protein MraZ, MraZ protein [Candidatus Taylorbacteria bacterium]